MGAKAPLPASLAGSVKETEAATSGGGSGSLTMLEAIREVLRYRMKSDEGMSLFGEDIEDPKGDVFGVTRGLTQAFPGRVPELGAVGVDGCRDSDRRWHLLASGRWRSSSSRTSCRWR